MALPKEPRQKMINIMYLVLTAILALNVSSEILNAFKTIEESFGKSNTGLAIRSEQLLKTFKNDELKKKFADKIAVWEPRALKVKETSDAIYNYIESLKGELKKDSKLQPDGKFNEDDLEAATRLFVTEESKKGKGEELYAKIDQYKKDLAAIEPTIASKVSSLPIDLYVPSVQNKDNESIIAGMPPPQKWSYVYFHMTPTIAGLAILSKFQNDIRNSEAQLIEYCLTQVSETQIPINEFGVIAGANATMVMSGDEIEIFAGVGGYNKDAKPSISIDGSNVPIGPDGKAVYKTTASSAGEFTKHITATFTNPNTGKLESKSTEVKYKVGIPTGINFSADATRFFYAGGSQAPNPITVSGSAGGANAIQVTAIAGIDRIEKTGNGTYNIICSKPGMATIKVSDGKSSNTQSIKIKALPDPQNAYVYGSFDPTTGLGGQAIANEFKLQSGLKAVLPNDFEFKGVTYTPKSFRMTFSGAGFSGGSVTVPCSSFAQAREQLSKCVAGTSVQISDILMVDNVSGEHKLKQTIGFYLK